MIKTTLLTKGVRYGVALFSTSECFEWQLMGHLQVLQCASTTMWKFFITLNWGWFQCIIHQCKIIVCHSIWQHCDLLSIVMLQLCYAPSFMRKPDSGGPSFESTMGSRIKMSPVGKLQQDSDWVKTSHDLRMLYHVALYWRMTMRLLFSSVRNLMSIIMFTGLLDWSWGCSLNVFVFVTVFLLVRSSLLITLIKCLKGHKSLMVLYVSVFQQRVSELVSYKLELSSNKARPAKNWIVSCRLCFFSLQYHMYLSAMSLNPSNVKKLD